MINFVYFFLQPVCTLVSFAPQDSKKLRTYLYTTVFFVVLNVAELSFLSILQKCRIFYNRDFINFFSVFFFFPPSFVSKPAFLNERSPNVSYFTEFNETPISL